MENEHLNLTEETIESPKEEVETVEAPVEDPETVEASEEEPETVESTDQKFSRKCDEIKAACRGTVDRIARDLKECNYNPYFRQTNSYKLEIYRDRNDETPIDVYETTEEKSFSARALALAGIASVAVMLVAKGIAKKLIK